MPLQLYGYIKNTIYNYITSSPFLFFSCFLTFLVVLVEKAVRKMQSKWSKKVKSKVRNGAKPIVDTMMVFMVNIGTNGFKESAYLF